ncbi:MAG: transferrin-binding protein-like solute binding protein [Betaproteobacteria bacterium]
MRSRSTVVPLCFTLLCACGGGKIEPDSISGISFSSFMSVLPGQTVNAIGSSQTQSITQDSTGVVTAQSVNSPDLSGANGGLTYASSSPLALKGFQFATPRSNVSWLDGRGNQHVSCGSQSCSGSGDGANGVLLNPTGGFLGNFQFFGYWVTASGLPANLVGGISAGRSTPTSSIPISGALLTYSGASGGIYISPAGALQEHGAALTVTFNPSGPTISFSTTGTSARPWNSAGVSSPANLDINGQVAYAPGSGRFTGTVTIGSLVAPDMTGTINGAFYGPNAEEIGGTFALTSTFGAIESMTGSFGGAR